MRDADTFDQASTVSGQEIAEESHQRGCSTAPGRTELGRPRNNCRSDEGRAHMTRLNVPLGRILGIPIGLDYSWFVIFALLTWMLASSYYPAAFSDWSPLLYWFMGAATAIMLFVSVLLHELGHSVVAQRYGIPVRSLTLF